MNEESENHPQAIFQTIIQILNRHQAVLRLKNPKNSIKCWGFPKKGHGIQFSFPEIRVHVKFRASHRQLSGNFAFAFGLLRPIALGVIAAAGFAALLTDGCAGKASFVRVSGLLIFSSSRNGVFESLRVIAVSFHLTGRIWFMTWCFEHQRVKVVHWGKDRLLAVWEVSDRAFLAPQAFSQTACLFPC